MELRRNQMKYFSSDNMRLLSSLILSLSSKQSAMENKLIDYWTPSTAYIKDESMVIYDDAIQICKISNADAVFDQNKWLKLSPEIDELTVNDVKAMLNLSQEELANLQSLIDDTSITTTKTNSSSKIYMDIQAAIAECKDDTLKQIAKKVSGSYKIASSTSDVISADFIYLISNGANYDLYVLVDSIPTRVGDTSIDLSDYAKLTDLDNYYDKNTSDGKFALITTVDAHINDTVAHLTQDERDKLVTTDELLKIANDTYIEDADNPTSTICKSNGDTLNTPYKEGITNASVSLIISVARGSDSWNGQISISMASNNIYVRNKGADGWCRWSKFLMETDIVTTINNLSTDTQIPSAKAIYNKSKNKINEVLSGGDIIAYADTITNETATDTVRFMNATNSPYGVNDVNNDFYYTIYNISDDNFKRIVAYDIRKNDMYMIMKKDGVWSPWEKIVTTKVADVPLTTLPLKDGYGGEVAYSVKNGYCLVLINGLTVPTSTVGATEFANVKLPCNRSNLGWVLMTNIDGDCGTLVTVDVHGTLMHHKSDSTKTYFGQYMYEVKEP